MQFENILFEKRDRIAFVTVNRPDVLNALSPKTLEELECCFYKIRDDEEIGAVILTGAGDKSFIAGADIKDLAKTVSLEERRNWLNRVHKIFDLVENLGKPVIAAINGYALGGGCEIALCCTLRIASENASFGQPEVNLGLIPGYGGTQRLPRFIGKGIAMELILTGKRIDAKEAYRVGLVNRVVPQKELIHEAVEIANQIISKPKIAVKGAMEAINKGVNMPLTQAVELEANIATLVFSSEDAKEGIKAFLEKRKPEFKGR